MACAGHFEARASSARRQRNLEDVWLPRGARPVWHAMKSGVAPVRCARSTAAPQSKQSVAASTWPWQHATYKGVRPPCRGRSTSAPRFRHSVAAARWPFSHATYLRVLDDVVAAMASSEDTASRGRGGVSRAGSARPDDASALARRPPTIRLGASASPRFTREISASPRFVKGRCRVAGRLRRPTSRATLVSTDYPRRSRGAAADSSEEDPHVAADSSKEDSRPRAIDVKRKGPRAANGTEASRPSRRPTPRRRRRRAAAAPARRGRACGLDPVSRPYERRFGQFLQRWHAGGVLWKDIATSGKKSARWPRQHATKSGVRPSSSFRSISVSESSRHSRAASSAPFRHALWSRNAAAIGRGGPGRAAAASADASASVLSLGRARAGPRRYYGSAGAAGAVCTRRRAAFLKLSGGQPAAINGACGHECCARRTVAGRGRASLGPGSHGHAAGGG